MKAHRCNILPFFFLLAFLGWPVQILRGEEQKKEFKKEYSATKDTRLSINNKFGNIDVRSWNQNRIVVEAVITVENARPDKTAQMLDNIEIVERLDGNTIALVTRFRDEFGKSDQAMKGKGKNNFHIDYVLQIPAWLTLDLSNRFGDIHITELTGLVNISLKFGRLEADRILRPEQKPRDMIHISYGDGFINEADWLVLDVKYYELEINKAQALLITSKHSEIGVHDVSSMVSQSAYDVIDIDRIHNLVHSGNFTSLNIGTLSNKLVMKTEYGKCEADHILPGFELISLQSSYTTYELGIDPAASYVIDGKASFAKIIVPENGEYSRQEENTSMSIKGRVGKASSTSSKLIVNTNFGNVFLIK